MKKVCSPKFGQELFSSLKLMKKEKIQNEKEQVFSRRGE